MSSNLLMNDTSLSTSSYNSTLGLRLTLSISNNTIPRDDGVSIRISLNNTLSEPNTIAPPQGNSSSGWTTAFSWNIEPCTAYPIGLEIFKGNYVYNNTSLTTGAPVDLVAPGVGSGCADRPWEPISFAPLSGNITSPDDWWLNKSADSVEYLGYWRGETFNSFLPGIYTIEGEDWWGQVTLVHFQVVSNVNALSCTTIASNPSFERGVANFSATPGPLKLEGFYSDLLSNNTIAFALTTTGDSNLSVGTLSLYSPYDSPNYVFSPLDFSDRSPLSPQTWQYYSSNGTLSDPAVFIPDKCSLVEVAFLGSFEDVPLVLYVGNQTQSFTIN